MSAAAGGGVDVLRNALDSLESREPFYPSMDDARAAVAAVAELIAAVQAEQAIRTEYQEWEALHPDEQVPRSFWERMASANKRTAAALSNIEGGQ